MTHFIAAYHTDAGIRKRVNQDSLLLKAISNHKEEIVLAVLCDGMGGIAKGELASATTILAFSDWFEHTYRKRAGEWKPKEIKEQWQSLFQQVNQALVRYGQRNGMHLGTTATAILISSKGEYLIGHIGDTRAYLLNHKLIQLTEDHTFIAREQKRGTMTREQAEADSRRNVLLQCVGINDFLEPQYAGGRLLKGESVLLCSDGFRHKVTEKELHEKLRISTSEEEIRRHLYELTEQNKKRMETDNISAIQVKLV